MIFFSFWCIRIHDDDVRLATGNRSPHFAVPPVPHPSFSTSMDLGGDEHTTTNFTSHGGRQAGRRTGSRITVLQFNMYTCLCLFLFFLLLIYAWRVTLSPKPIDFARLPSQGQGGSTDPHCPGFSRCVSEGVPAPGI